MSECINVGMGCNRCGLNGCCAESKAYQQGRRDAIDECLGIVKEMHNSAESQMMFREVNACEKLFIQIEQIKEQN